MRKTQLLAGASEVGEHDPIVFIHDLGTDRNLQDEILAVGASALASGAGAAVLSPKMLPIPVIDQGVQVVSRDKDDVAAFAAVAAVGAAELDELLAAKAHRAASAITALQVNLALIEELHLCRLKRGAAGPLPFGSAASGNGYSAASAGGSAGGTTET